MVVERQSQLLKLVRAGRPPGCFAGLLHGWQQQADEDANNGNHYQ